jgi:hypothetical protein
VTRTKDKAGHNVYGRTEGRHKLIRMFSFQLKRDPNKIGAGDARVCTRRDSALVQICIIINCSAYLPRSYYEIVTILNRFLLPLICLH